MVGGYGNILLIKPSSLGDIVLALPALSALRRNFPQARLAWLVRPEFAPLIEGHPHLDEIILFDRRRLAHAWRSPTAARSLLTLVSELRGHRFDAVLDLQGLFRTGLLARLSGSPRRFGPRWREMAYLFYTTSIPPRREWIHVVDYYLRLVGAMGAADLRAEFVLPEKPAAAAAARALLSHHSVSPGRYAVMIPGSAEVGDSQVRRMALRRPGKCWPPERFAALADRLAGEHELTVVATGSKSESPVIEEIRSLSRHPVVNLASQTSLPELVEVLRGARLVVSNDTGPGHIAAALGRPLAILFSWSNPLRVGPYGRPECVVARDVSSRGLANRSRNPRHGIQNITLDEVYAKAVEQLHAEKAGGCRP